MSCIGNVFYYDLFSRGGQAAMIVPLTALYPLATILLAMVLLRERLNRIQLGGVLFSLIAIYLFNVQREAGFLSGWLVYALAPIILWGAAGFLQKLSTNHISGELSTLWFLAAFIPFGALFLAQGGLPAANHSQHLGARYRARLSPGPGQLRDPGGLRQPGQSFHHRAARRPLPGGERADRHSFPRRKNRGARGARDSSGPGIDGRAVLRNAAAGTSPGRLRPKD